MKDGCEGEVVKERGLQRGVVMGAINFCEESHVFKQKWAELYENVLVLHVFSERRSIFVKIIGFLFTNVISRVVGG